MRYLELKSLIEQWQGKICFFGAGLVGTTWAYDLLKAMEAQIDFYCDNKVANNEIRNGISTISPEYLYTLGNNVLVFVTVSYKYQKGIREQLEKNGIHNIIQTDYLFMQTIIEDLLEIDDPLLFKKFKCILDDKEYICRQFEYHLGRRPELDPPQTFNEKIQWLKLYDREPIYTKIVDKYEAKNYIAGKIGDEYIVPTLGVYDSFDDINFEDLPKQFVIKCTHDSGSIVICKDKDQFNKDEVKDDFERRLKQNFYWVGREWPYKNVKPRIMVEKYLNNKNAEELIDYKFLCMNGKHMISFTCSNRFRDEGLCVNFYDKQWNPLPFERHYPKRKEEIMKPLKYNVMVDIAERLSAGIKFVRVDFYAIEEKIYVGEMTFYPGNGVEEFSPIEWDYKLGEMLQL